MNKSDVTINNIYGNGGGLIFKSIDPYEQGFNCILKNLTVNNMEMNNNQESALLSIHDKGNLYIKE